MMGTNLQQLLRSLCLDAGWDYAVFWKLKHHARMVLTWGDAYCHSHANIDHCGGKCDEHLESFRDGQFPHDPLGLALAKMSYHVYSFGEGIVGQVAATGKHEWVVVDRHSVNPLTSSEHCDGWQAQFLAGIQTIVVAAVIPHGVVQLGSLGKVNEDPKLLTHLRDLFSVVQDASAGHVSNSAGQSFPTLLPMPDMSLAPEVHPGRSITLSIPFQKGGGLHSAVLRGGGRETVTRNKRLVSSVSEGAENVKMVSSAGQMLESEVVNFDAVQKAGSSSLCDSAEPQSSYGAVLCALKSGVESNCSSSRSFDQRPLMEVGKNMEFQSEDSILDTLMSSCNLSAGYELHEALGPGFLKQDYPRWCEVEKCEPKKVCEIAEGMEPTMIKSATGSDNLLEAVVADFCHKGSSAKIVKPSSTSVDSLLTNERVPEPSNSTSHTVGSARYSIDSSSILEESAQHCLASSESYDMRSMKGFSSSSPNSYKEQLSRQSEPAKGSKKRSRASENCRPRPRDRQLIQDRIKELRELVPNGSKCSIDSLLERTVKHMLFLQCVTKHAGKLNKCARSRVSNDSGISGCSNHEQGASWAVEVGCNMKSCPIAVENLNMNGQMLIEMLCEDCDHFLEVAEAIRGLGLIILKGITESDGDKTWMRFVVEGQNSGNMRRMDVLWSLVQTLQTKASNC